MTPEVQDFFSSALSAGAILTGFCGTFLSFRIQREANYHRQPAVDFRSGLGRDVYIGGSHFSSGFLMLILASLVTMTFGFILPLLALSGTMSEVISVRVVSGGLLSGLVLICGYFVVELRHYRILSNRLISDGAEWGRQKMHVVAFVHIAVGVYLVVRYL